MKRKRSKEPSHKWWYFAAGAVLLFLLAGVAVCYNDFISNRDHSTTDTNWSLIARRINFQEDPTIGSSTAPIQLIVYADFQCLYCGTFFNYTLPRLQKIYGGKFAVAFRDLPLEARMPQSPQEADAGECVFTLGGNDAFWKFAHEIYAIPNFQKGIDLSTVPQLAARAGVDKTKYEECIQAGREDAEVKKDKLEGMVAGLDLTPSVVLKSAHRALIVKGDSFAGLVSGIYYLLQTNAEIEQMKK